MGESESEMPYTKHPPEGQAPISCSCGASRQFDSSLETEGFLLFASSQRGFAARPTSRNLLPEKTHRRNAPASAMANIKKR
jgi:hypothetical protein